HHPCARTRPAAPGHRARTRSAGRPGRMKEPTMKPSTHRRAKGAAEPLAPDNAGRHAEHAGCGSAGDAPIHANGADAAWQPICRLDDLIPDAGIAARAHGEQVAVFLTEAGPFALDHVDPFCGAAVLARGIVG